MEGPQESQGLGPGLSYLAGQGLSTREMKDMGMSQRQVKNVRERESIAGIWSPTRNNSVRIHSKGFGRDERVGIVLRGSFRF